MPLACLLLVILVSAADDPSPRAWAARLASTSSEERHAAIDALDAQGLAALPTLRAIVSTSSDDVRSLATELIERIGTRRLLKGTPVVLARGERPIREAVEQLAAASGFAIDLDTVQGHANRVITPDREGSIGFYEALDQVAKAGGLRHDASAYFPVAAKRGVRIRLVPTEDAPPPTAYAGPYKVSVNALERHREVIQARPPAKSAVREEFFVVLDVVAEPGILIDRNGPLRLQEAVDEHGADLRAASSQDPSAGTTYRQWSQDTLGSFVYRLPLTLPADRGARIARLRGFVPITAIARTEELFSSSMDAIGGKTISGGGVTLRVARASMTDTPRVLEITVQGEPAPDFQAFAAGPRQTSLATLHLNFNPDDHLRIEDANGVPFTTSSTGNGPPQPDGSMSYRVTIFDGRATGRPARLRYFAVAGVATEVPFDFRDLAIP